MKQTDIYKVCSHPSRIPLAAFELRRLLFDGTVDLHTKGIGTGKIMKRIMR